MTDSRSRSDALSELDAATRLRVRIAGLAAALVTALLVAFGGAALRQPLFDVYQTLSPTPDISKRVHVVVIDADSLRAVGGWPWTRFYLARLVEEITNRGAAVIGFDLLFPEPDRLDPSQFTGLYKELSPTALAELEGLPSMDAVFARVIGRSPVVLARAGLKQDSFDTVDGDDTPPLPPEAQFEGPPPDLLPSFPTVVANLPILDGAPLGHGLVNGDPDADGVVRRVPLLAKAEGKLTPSFALELVRVAEGDDKITLESNGESLRALRVGGHRVLTAPDGGLVLRFGDWRRTQTSSAANVLRQGSKDDFKNQIVLIGLASAGTSDVVNTPRAKEIYGVFVQAQAVDAILRGAGLHRPFWTFPLEWGLGLVAVLIAVVGAPRAPMSLMVTGAGVEIAAAVGGSWLAFQNNILLDPIPMLAPGAATSTVMVAMLFVEGRRVQRRLRASLDDERLSAARISGELAAASEIQSGMLLPRDALAHVSPTVEIDAVLQPARTVGGDLYDAFRFDDGRVCFLVGDVTGKGVPASLFMALSKALSRSLLMRPNFSLQSAIEGINAELSRDNGQAMAVSLLVGVLHPDDGQLHLCSAGHENPLVVDPNGSVRELKLEGGPPLCVADDYPYPVETHHLAPGEILVAFTDGLTEAQSPDETLFSRDQLLAAVAQASRADSLMGVVDSLVASVRAFEAGGEPSDDLTVMAVRRRPVATA